MIQLKPCPTCQRHLKIHESNCPFCQGELPAEFAIPHRRVLPEARLGRAATFAFGVGMVLTQATACKDDSDDADDASAEEARHTDGGRGNADAAVEPDASSDEEAAPDSGSEDPDWDDNSTAIYASAPTVDDGTRLAGKRAGDGTHRS